MYRKKAFGVPGEKGIRTGKKGTWSTGVKKIRVKNWGVILRVTKKRPSEITPEFLPPRKNNYSEKGWVILRRKTSADGLFIGHPLLATPSQKSLDTDSEKKLSLCLQSIRTSCKHVVGRNVARAIATGRNSLLEYGTSLYRELQIM